MWNTQKTNFSQWGTAAASQQVRGNQISWLDVQTSQPQLLQFRKRIQKDWMCVCLLLQTWILTGMAKKVQYVRIKYGAKGQGNKAVTVQRAALGNSLWNRKSQHENSWCDKRQHPSALPLSDSCPLSVVAGHTIDALALHKDWSTACWSRLDTF